MSSRVSHKRHTKAFNRDATLQNEQKQNFRLIHVSVEIISTVFVVEFKIFKNLKNISHFFFKLIEK